MPVTINASTKETLLELTWNASCFDSLNEYKKTGLHVTQLEVEKWMDSLGTDSELPQPVCHAQFTL